MDGGGLEVVVLELVEAEVVEVVEEVAVVEVVGWWGVCGGARGGGGVVESAWMLRYQPVCTTHL